MISIIAATILYRIRKRNGVSLDTHRWGNDALGFGTMIVLALLLLAPLAKAFLPLPSTALSAFSATTKANAILVMTALANCIRTVWSGTVRDLENPTA